MGKKKGFVDKKRCATFRLVCRDSASPDGYGHVGAGDRVFIRVDGGGGYVPGFTDDDPQTHFEHDPADSIFADADEDDLDADPHFSKQQKKTDALPNSYNVQRPLPDHLRREIIELGFPDDGYNYLLHLREVGSSGGGSSFVPNTKAKLERMPPDLKAYDASKLRVQACDEDRSDGNAFYGVSSSTFNIQRVQKIIDPEVAAHLENSDGSQYGSDCEEFADDFVIQANQPKEAAAEDFDGVASVELIKAKEPEHRHTVKSVCAEDGSVAFSTETGSCGSLRPATGDAMCGFSSQSKNERTPRLLDEQFELLALHEYGDDENDSTDSYDNEVVAPSNGHAFEIGNAMKEFLRGNLDFQDKYTVPADGISERIPERSSMKHKEEHNFVASQSDVTPMDDVLRKCAEYADMYANESQEEKEFVIVEDSSDNERDVWDCETIVSTYSNLNNHPVKITAPQKFCRKDVSGSSHGDSELNGSLISLRGRQQLPVDFLPQRESSARVRNAAKPKPKTHSANSRISGPGKSGAFAEETLEQKKARKAAVKEEKREARRAKKEMRTLYRVESQRAQHIAAVTGPPGIHLL